MPTMPSPAVPRWSRSAYLIFAVALLYRLGVGIHFLLVNGMAAQWTNEVAGVARSLVLHHAFAGAYQGYAGPTAWTAPVYPLLVAGVFFLFGINSGAAGVILLVLNAVFASLTAIVIYQLGREYLGETVGLLAAWAWALSPLGVLMPLLLWDTSLSALVLTVAILVLLRARGLRQWIAAGALWGVSALVSPALLAPLPVILAAKLWSSPQRMKLGLSFCLAVVAVLLPWTIRNEVELHGMFPVRSNAWAEIYFGNVTFAVHPCASPTGLYQQIGEARFVRQLKGETLEFIQTHPGQFLWASVQRMVRFWLVPINFALFTAAVALAGWIGLVLLCRRDVFLAVIFGSVAVLYPVIYSITHIETRYRHPIEPIVFLLAAYAVCEIAAPRQQPAMNREQPQLVSATQ